MTQTLPRQEKILVNMNVKKTCAFLLNITRNTQKGGKSPLTDFQTLRHQISLLASLHNLSNQ